MKGGSIVIKISGTAEELSTLREIMFRRLLNDTVEVGWLPTKSGREFHAEFLGKEIKFEEIR